MIEGHDCVFWWPGVCCSDSRVNGFLLGPSPVWSVLKLGPVVTVPGKVRLKRISCKHLALLDQRLSLGTNLGHDFCFHVFVPFMGFRMGSWTAGSAAEIFEEPCLVVYMESL